MSTDDRTQTQSAENDARCPECGAGPTRPHSLRGHYEREAAKDALVQIVGAIISDHPMWQGIDYTMERERRISEFCHEVAEAMTTAGYRVIPPGRTAP